MSRQDETDPVTSTASKGISRGQFLAGAAAATAGLAPPMYHASVGEDDSEQQAPACGTKQCEPSRLTDTWAIPGGVLNTLWSHVIPRVVAQAWASKESLVGWGGRHLAAITHRNPDPTGPEPDRVAADQAITNLGASGNWWPRSAWEGSAEFDTRRAELYAYLNGPNQIPIRIMAEGGFDFVLSNQGLDIFVPRRPRTVAELMHYYTFRATGRRSLGIPYYLDSSVSAVNTDSPTGPSMASLSSAGVAALIRLAEGDTACMREVIHCLELHRARPADEEDRQDEYDLQLTQESFQCIMDLVRCWQVSGAVYRGIMTELPRVVAQVWLERTLPPPANTLPSSYNVRFTRTDNYGLREIFRERLETSIPHRSRMLFEQFTPATDGIGWPKDVIITNRGFFVPAVADLATLITDPDPLTDMFNEMRKGDCGNPVFTDSQRTE